MALTKQKELKPIIKISALTKITFNQLDWEEKLDDFTLILYDSKYNLNI